MIAKTTTAFCTKCNKVTEQIDNTSYLICECGTLNSLLNCDGTPHPQSQGPAQNIITVDAIPTFQDREGENWFVQNRRFAEWFLSSGLDPFTISYEDALKIYNQTDSTTPNHGK